MTPSCDFYREMMQCSSGLRDPGQTAFRNNICGKLSSRQFQVGGLSEGQRVNLTQHMMPRHPHQQIDFYRARVFCGTYNRDGSMFISAVQVYVCNVYGEEENHYSLDLRPDTLDRFCVFSLRFSSDDKELITACSDGYLYIYNREICDRTLKIDAHQDDADAVALDDQSSHIIFSAGDDGLCKVWDRRCLSEANPRPVGTLAGHKDGITFIDTKGDGRHLITNSKDQTIKLWDIRQFSQRDGIAATLGEVQRQSWDYRWQDVPKRVMRDALVKLPGDSSVMTYAGHLVKHTLLRARFSPPATTGQRYIYTACAKGRVVVYDTLTGEVVQTLMTDNYNCVCVRDVSWSPSQPGELVSSSWDGLLQLWIPHPRIRQAGAGTTSSHESAGTHSHII
ncbi:DDB1- and CUL4-associated factor 11 [Geodia barretti]|uniref:DDB1- and CUL4-associated factor 11 n=1 Tax=Geodia barretti TaxID=519541 RepID=A0AA35RQ75_GEOBA|nr:DDB1- and CUL4-associated factor 11 [Geodia barretti]